jgi:hypothetical protein
VRDRAVASFAGAIATNFPSDAMTWAQSVSDPVQRLRQTVAVARTWLKVDQPAATTWITNSDLPEARKNQLLGLPPPAPPPPAGNP